MSKRRRGLIEERLTRSVIGAFFDVYNELGFGFLERVYTKALERELVGRGHKVEREVTAIIRYRGEPLDRQRLDFVVDEKLVLETKSTEILSPGALRQLHNYLRATELDVGLLLHFGLEPRFYRAVNRKRSSRPEPAGTPDGPNTTQAC